MQNEFNVVITDTAKQDIREASAYIAYTLCNPQAAKKLRADITAAIDRASSFPESESKSSLKPYMRKIVVNNYLLFFTINSELRQIEIIRFLYAGRNIKKDDF